MSVKRYVIASILLSLILGCGGESTQDKFLRMAEARAKINRVEKEAASKAETSEAEQKPEPEPLAKEVVKEDTAKKSRPDTAKNETPQSAQIPSEAKVTTASSSGVIAEAVPTVFATPQASLPRRDQMLAFGRLGKQVAYAGSSQSIGVYDVSTKQLARQLYNPQLSPFSLAISENGKLLAAGGVDGGLKVFPLESAEGLDRFQQNRLLREDNLPPRNAHDGPVTAVAVTDAVGIVATGGADGEIKLWSTRTDPALELTGNADGCASLLSYQEDQLLFSANEKGISYWQMDRQQTEASDFSRAPLAGVPTTMIAGPDGKGLAVGDASGRITLWTPENNELKKASFSAHNAAIDSIGFVDGGSSLVTVARDGDVAKWNLPIAEQRVFDIVEKPDFVVTSPDGKHVGMPSHGSNFDLYSVSDGKAVRRHTNGKRSLTAADFSGDASIVALADSSGRVSFQDENRLSIAYRNLANESITRLRRSPDGTRFAYSTSSGSIGLASYPDLAGRVLGNGMGDLAAVNRSGTRVLMARGKELKLVNLADGEILRSARLADAEITAVGLDDGLAVIGTSSGNVMVWSLLGVDAEPESIGQFVHSTYVKAIGLTRFGTVWSCDADGISKQTAMKKVAHVQSGDVGFAIKEIVSLNDGSVFGIDDAQQVRYASKPDDAAQPLADVTAKTMTSGGDRLATLDVDGLGVNVIASDHNRIARIIADLDTPFASVAMSRRTLSMIREDGSAVGVVMPSSGPVERDLPGGEIRELVTSPDGRVLVYRDGSGDLYSSTALGSGRKLILPGQSNSQPIALSKDGRFLAVATGGRTLCYEIGRSAPRLMTIFADSILKPAGAAFTNDSSRVLFAMPNKDLISASVSDVKDVKKIGQTKQLAAEVIVADSRLLVRDVAGDLIIREVGDGSVRHESTGLKFTAMSAAAEDIYLGTDTGTIYRVSGDEHAPQKIMKLAEGKPIAMLSASVRSSEATDSDLLLAALSADGKLMVVDPVSQVQMTATIDPPDARPMAILLGQHQMSFVRTDGKLTITPIGTIAILTEPDSKLTKLAISGDGKHLLAVKSSGDLMRWTQTNDQFSAPQAVTCVSTAIDLVGIGSQDQFAIVNGTSAIKYSAVSDKTITSVEVEDYVEKICAASRNDVAVVKTAKGIRAIDFRRETVDLMSAEFAKLASEGVFVSIAENGTAKWFAFAHDGKFVKGDRLSEQTAESDFSVGYKPKFASIEGGFLFTSLPEAIEVRRDDGQVFAKLPSTGKSVVAMAVDPHRSSVTACDESGSLMTLVGDESAPVRTRLSLKNVSSLIWSADGTEIAAASGNRIAVIDARTGKLQSQMLVRSRVSKLIHWQGDRLSFLDAASRLGVVATPRIHWTTKVGEAVSDIAFSDSGSALFACTATGNVTQIDSVDGNVRRRVATGRTNLRQLISIPTTDRMAFLAGDSDIVLMDADGTTADYPTLSALGLRSLVSAPDRDWVFASNNAGQVLSWHLSKRDQAPSMIPCDIGCGILAAAVGDKLIAVGSDEAKIAVVSSSMRVNVIAQSGGRNSDSAVSPNGAFAAFVDQSSKVRLVSLAGGNHREVVSDGVSFGQLAIHPGATHFAALGTNQVDGQDSLVVWETIDLKSTGRSTIQSGAHLICYSHDGGLIAVGFKDGHVEVFDSLSAKRLESLAPVEGLQQIAFVGNGSKVTMAGADGVVRVESLTSLGRAKASSTAIVSLGFHGGGKYLLSGSMDGRLTFWNRAAFSAPQAAFDGLTAAIIQSTVSIDGRYVLAVYDDTESSTFIWDLDASGGTETKIAPKLVIRSDVKSTSATFTSDAKFLLIGGVDGVIRAWSLSEGREVARFRQHDGPVTGIAPLSDAGQFVSGGVDHSIRSWKFPSTLPGPGAEIPQGALADATEVKDLTPPEIDNDLGKDDPHDAARQALIAGARTTDILDLMEGEDGIKKDAKQSLTRVLEMEKNTSVSAVELSRERRRLAATQRRMDPSDIGKTLSSFSDGFSNLSFVGNTNFKFGTESIYRPVKLLFADRFLYAARTSAANRRRRVDEDGNEIKVDIGDNGALLSWDYRYSGLQAHAWSTEDLNVKELYPLSQSGGVFTVPQMMLFSQDGSSRQLASVASWAISKSGAPNRQFLAVGTAGAQRAEEDILKVFDVADFSRENVSPVSQYRSFEGVVTAMAFANNAPFIAFSIRERAVHRLFIADAETLRLQKLEEINHDQPWLDQDSESGQVTRRNDAAPGVTSMTFSPDDRTLIVHGKYDDDEFKLSTWDLDWDEAGQLKSFKKAFRELTNPGPFFVESGSQPIRFVTKPGEESNFRRILVRVRDGFSVVNIASQRAEQKIDFLKTHHGIPEHAVSENGRWIAMGDDNGMAYIWDTIKGDRYSLTMTTAVEDRMKETKARLRDIREKPAHSGPIVGVSLSDPDPGKDYPAFAATIGEENKLKVWELFPILDPESGLRARN